MGLFDSIKSRRTAKNSANEVPITFADLQSMLAEKNEARNLSGVYQCIELISNTVSKLPFFVLDNNTKKHIDDTNIYHLLNLQPNPNMTASVFKKTITSILLLKGNVYILPVWKGLKIVKLDILDNDKMTITKVGGEYIYTYNSDEQKNYRYDEIVHIRINAKKGIEGISPLTYARLTTSVGLKQEEFQESFYTNGGRPDGVLKTQSDLSTKKVEVNGKMVSLKDVMRDAWKTAHAGSDNRFNIAILDNGLDYQTIQQISPADMDFVNSKTTNIEDICRFFNVPPYKLGVGKQTYSNNEQANIEYITNTIVPLITQFEQELTLKLLTDMDIKKGRVIKCNVEAEMRGDSGSRGAWYKLMQSIGAYSINEIRALENLPDIENGDVRLIGANSTPLERLINGDTVGDMTPNPISENMEGTDEQ